jgi:hypothetical protein
VQSGVPLLRISDLLLACCRLLWFAVVQVLKVVGVVRAWQLPTAVERLAGCGACCRILVVPAFVCCVIPFLHKLGFTATAVCLDVAAWQAV